MKSGSAGVDHAAARAFAFETGIVGAGWGLNDSPVKGQVPDRSPDLELYLRHAEVAHPGDQSMRKAAAAFGERMQIGDYCWTYVTHTGEYWCCRIEGEFEYREGGEFDRFDLHMARPCTWALAGSMDAVPGVVRRAFAGPFGSVTALTSGTERAIQAARTALGETSPAPVGDLMKSAGPEDLEDLVAMYLQREGWWIYPSTAKTSTASYEFVMVHSETGHRAGIQVKSGNVDRITQAVATDLDRFFILLGGSSAPPPMHDPRISFIAHDEITRFASEHIAQLPKRLRADAREQG